MSVIGQTIITFIKYENRKPKLKPGSFRHKTIDLSLVLEWTMEWFLRTPGLERVLDWTLRAPEMEQALEWALEWTLRAPELEQALESTLNASMHAEQSRGQRQRWPS